MLCRAKKPSAAIIPDAANAAPPFAAAAITGAGPYRTTLMAWKYTLPAFVLLAVVQTSLEANIASRAVALELAKDGQAGSLSFRIEPR